MQRWLMTGESVGLDSGEREILGAALARWTTADHAAVRALIALSDDAHERIARLTAMGREFVVETRRRVREAGAEALLAAELGDDERILEAATDQIVQPGPRELTLSAVSDQTGIPLRTLYNKGMASGDLVEMCRRRGQTIWRARFEQRVLRSDAASRERLFAAVDVIAEWVGSERFRRDELLRARPSFAPEMRGDALREHLAEIARFAAGLALDAGVALPERYGALVATLVAGVAAWYDRCEAARAVALDAVACAIGDSPER
jgi:AcrR family transcriptional regulator